MEELEWEWAWDRTGEELVSMPVLLVFGATTVAATRVSAFFF